MLTQRNMVLEYLKNNRDKGITSMEAFQLFGATRLSAIIFDLKKSGNIIVSKNESVKTRYGGNVTVSRYFYKEVANE